MATKVSIVILTYNSEKYVEKLVKSIYEFNEGSDFEIIVIDNNSEDNSVEEIRKIQQTIQVQSKDTSKVSIKLIQNRENVGFAKGINMGVKEARGKYLLFINPDAEWKNGSVDDFASLFESDNRVGVIGGRILAKNGIAERSAGRFLKMAEVFLTALSLDKALGVRFSPNETQEVDFVSGGFMAVRKSLFEKLSGFDENLFMYVEDMEFCYRVKQARMKVAFDPSIEIIHESHGSSNRGFAIENIYKGIIYFHKKHGNVFSYSAAILLLKSKALALVLLGKIINNKYLTATYSKALKI